MSSAWVCICLLLVAAVASAGGEGRPSITGELPDPFVLPNGSRVRTPGEWRAQRKRLLEQVLTTEYGALPPAARNVIGAPVSSRMLDGVDAEERVIRLSMGPRGSVHTHLTLTLPRKQGAFPTIVCGDFVAGDRYWVRVPQEIVREIVGRGYALAEFDRVEIASDSAERTGVYAAYPNYTGGRSSAWAWGYHRVIDYLEKQPFVDRNRIIATGHSRGGKAVLLAGATDERIALTAPNNSGCGGAGCFRYQAEKSEDIAAILKNFPYWFAPDFGRFIGHIDQLPVDQHTVKALVAPRALLSTEGMEDLWANPERYADVLSGGARSLCVPRRKG